MSFTLLAAISENGAIGKDNTLLWHLPSDMKHFRETTRGRVVVMGRKTFLSIGRLLPDRENIILTRDADFSYEGATVIRSVKELRKRFEQTDTEVFIIGGGEIYKEMMPFAQKLLITHVHKHFEGDTFFPNINKREWELISAERKEADEINNITLTISTYERKHLEYTV